MNIDWKTRLTNPVVLAQLALSIALPVLAYQGLTVQDMITWGAVWGIIRGAVSNPYVLGLMAVSAWNCINDPTTPGLTDGTTETTTEEE